MFTIKYRTFRRAPQQLTDGPTNYCMHEQLHGPFDLVSQEVDENDGQTVVHAHRGDGPGVMFKDCSLYDTPSAPRPTLWVMNESGATVAKYDL